MQKLQLQLGPYQVLMRHLKASKFSSDLIEFHIEYSSNRNVSGSSWVKIKIKGSSEYFDSFSWYNFLFIYII